jgi:hypothetical protein
MIEMMLSEEEKNQGWTCDALPKLSQRVEVLIHDYAGSYRLVAMRKPYKKPPHKGMKKGCWRWVDETGERLDRKRTPSAWRPLQSPEVQ